MKIRSQRETDARNNENGNVTVEFVGILVVIVLPALILLSSLAVIFNAQFAVQAAARDAARELVRSESFHIGHAQAVNSARATFNSRGVSSEPKISIRCDRVPCLSPNGNVTVDVTAAVELPLMGMAISVSDSQTMAAGDFRVTRP